MRLAAVVLVVFLGCGVPSREDVKNDCKEIADEAVTQALDICIQYYEAELIPALQSAIETLRQECQGSGE
jgi:hypothetical protein